nr:MAG TPA: ParB protein [Caudoviricetes sp.]
MDIVNLKLSEIKPYENNPRYNDDAVDKVAKSIQEFGFKVPIVVDKDGVIIAGHTRLKAAKKIGLKEVPVIVAKDLSPAKVKAFRLADNKVSDYSIWDNKKLLEELESMEEGIFTGFEFSDFMNDVESMNEITELDEADKSVIEDNEDGIEYKLTFRTTNKQLIEDIQRLIEESGELDG